MLPSVFAVKLRLAHGNYITIGSAGKPCRIQISFEDWKEMRDEADTFIAEMEDELTRLRAVSISDVLPIGDKLREAWTHMPVDTRRAVIRLVVDKVVVRPSKAGFAVWNGYRFKPEDITIVLKSFGRPVEVILEGLTSARTAEITV